MTILRFIRVILIGSLTILTALGALPNPTQATQSDGTLTVFWAPLAFPASSAYGFNPIDKKGGNCVDGLEGLSQGRCGSDQFSNLMNTLSPCETDQFVSCITSLSIQLPNQSWQTANYLGSLSPPKVSWSSNTQFDLGPANDSSIFTTNSQSGVQIQWLVTIHYRLLLTDINSGVAGPSDYTISIAPVQKITPGECVWNTQFESLLLIAGGATNFRDYCYKRLQQPSSFKAKLSLSLNREPRGWITSYLQQFEGKLERPKAGSKKFELTLEGSNSPSPISALQISSNDSEGRARFCSLPVFSNQSRCTGKPWMQSLQLYRTTGGQRDIGKDTFLNMLNSFPELDTAARENISWSVDLNMNNDAKINSCDAPQGIYGVVGGNAMITEDRVPMWNSSKQTLEFEVTSPHFKSNGQVARGFYEMQLNEKVANCLWGTKITPTNVSLSVTDENGESKVANAATSVRNGMVIFRATGFTYSSTKLSVSLKRLVCTKNGVLKTLSKGKKSCPKGWKRL
jgi:hypothetical protein